MSSSAGDLSKKRQLLFSAFFGYLELRINCNQAQQKKVVIHDQPNGPNDVIHPRWTSQFANYFLINQIEVPQGRGAGLEEPAWQCLSGDQTQGIQGRGSQGYSNYFHSMGNQEGTMGGRAGECSYLTSLQLPRQGTQHMLFIGKPIILNRGTGDLNDICKP